MADYYPLIQRAISGLDPGASGEARRALYERARTALIAQLRGVQPPLSESEITRERLALEEAVRRVESEAAQRARENRTDSARNDRQEPRARAGDALRGSVRARTPPPEGPSASPIRDRPPSGSAQRPQRNLRADAPADFRDDAAPSRPQPPRPDQRQDSQNAPRQEARPEPRQDPRQDARSDPRNASPPRRPNEPQRGAQLRGFRDVVADADELGAAAAEANRAARRTYANVPSPTPEFDRLEPDMENRGADPSVPYSYDESADEAARYSPASAPRPKPAPDKRGPKPPKKPKPPRAPSRFPLKSAIAIGILLMLVGVAFTQKNQIMAVVRGLMKPSQTVETPKVTPENGTRPKIADRVGQPGQTIAPVAQKVVLYDEDPAEPQGKQFVGQVIWRTELVNASAGGRADLAVRADVEVPERKLRMTFTIRRNTDASLPASHTAEVTFALPPDFGGGSIANVPGVLMKSNEQARGTPLAGLAVKVTDGFFLVGLSNVETDRARNLQLLKERSWFDIPLVYGNQRRAILAIEKGAPGERAFNEAFIAWGQ